MIRIVLAEDQEMLLGAIGSLLNLEEDMEVVGQASNGKDALTLVHQLKPHVCIMDVEMPEKNGLEAAEALKSSGCIVIILTTFARHGYFQRALNADVKGYLLKDSPSEELASAVRSTVKGKEIFSPELIDQESASNDNDLLELFDDSGNPKKTTAHQPNTIETVKKYVTNIMHHIKRPTG